MRRARGFTLVEVMIAIAILGVALGAMLSKVAGDMNATQRAKLLGAATGLARAKMLDLEEELTFKGFQETEEELEGDFSEEGFSRFTWKAKIEKVQLPALSQMQTAQGAAAGAESGAAQSLTGMIGQGGGNATAAAGASIISSQFEMVSTVLEAAIRKVTLTVEWQVGPNGKKKESLVVVCYFTDPKAVDIAVGGLLGGGLPGGGGDPGGGGGGGGR